VPDLSIQRDIAGFYVLVVDDQDMVHARYVKLGPKVDLERVIEGGLERDERVVVNGIQRARPGIKVTALSQVATD
jgi:membrane fusion protein (multidrug efflux system)